MSLNKSAILAAFNKVGAVAYAADATAPVTLGSLLGARIQNRTGTMENIGFAFGSESVSKAAAAKAAAIFCFLLTQELGIPNIQREQSRDNSTRKVVGMALNASSSVNPNGKGSIGDTVIWLNGPNASVLAEAFEEIVASRRKPTASSGVVEATPQSRIMGAANMESLATIMADLNMPESLILELDDAVQAAPEGARRGLAFRNARTKAFEAFMLGGKGAEAPEQTTQAAQTAAPASNIRAAETVGAPDDSSDIPF